MFDQILQWVKARLSSPQQTVVAIPVISSPTGQRDKAAVRGFLKPAVLPALLLCSSLFFFACKGKDKSSNTGDTTTATQPATRDTSMTPPPAPVKISADDSLKTMATDAIKDYPGVTATVNNGEVTLTGDITRAKLPKLMSAISATHPKKINNNLTIK